NERSYPMPTPWLKRIREAAQLSVYNKAAAWAHPVEAAIRTFNHLSFGVKLVATKEESAADVVLVLAMGPAKYDWPGNRDYQGSTLKPRAGCRADALHGQTTTTADPNLGEIVFAAVFLPGGVKATDRQKEVVVVHEFFHCCGLDGGRPDGKQDPNQDHDTV